APHVELPPGQHLLLRLELELHRQRLAQFRRLLRRALLKDLLLLGGDALEALEQLVAVLREDDLLAAQLCRGQLAERLLLLAEDLVDEGHARVRSSEFRTSRLPAHFCGAPGPRELRLARSGCAPGSAARLSRRAAASSRSSAP